MTVGCRAAYLVEGVIQRRANGLRASGVNCDRFFPSPRPGRTQSAGRPLYPRGDRAAGTRSEAGTARSQRGFSPRAGRARPRGRSAVAACAGQVGRPRPGPSRDGGGVRGRRMVAAGPARAQYHGARRGQHQSARQDCERRAEGTMAAAAGSGRDSHRILDDRARRRRRLGSQPDEDHGAPSRRRICHLGAQVVNHRRSRREHQHRDGAHAR